MLKPSLKNFKKHPDLTVLFLLSLAVNVLNVAVYPPSTNPSSYRYMSHGLIGVVVLILGASGFVLRDWSPRTYGVIELLFATITAIQIAMKTPLGHEMIALGGAVYVVVRGMGNIYDGQSKKSAAEANTTLCIRQEQPS
jgi:branched-subunit amino acid transport protein AzlD